MRGEMLARGSSTSLRDHAGLLAGGRREGNCRGDEDFASQFRLNHGNLKGAFNFAGRLPSLGSGHVQAGSSNFMSVVKGSLLTSTSWRKFSSSLGVDAASVERVVSHCLEVASDRPSINPLAPFHEDIIVMRNLLRNGQGPNTVPAPGPNAAPTIVAGQHFEGKDIDLGDLEFWWAIACFGMGSNLASAMEVVWRGPIQIRRFLSWPSIGLWRSSGHGESGRQKLLRRICIINGV
ncbi:hypothetical protein Bca52824_066163 [Brassica carinata]|uniref:Uncharacterized protein n=1 Tax=Brassica carinata TaxID=52824 RepID=A0A8X7QPX3_BRACI|nr:hypothetical protein Bca52824_066163 [Brassica carinata]